jgi:hypothetical protein
MVVPPRILSEREKQKAIIITTMVVTENQGTGTHSCLTNCVVYIPVNYLQHYHQSSVPASVLWPIFLLRFNQYDDSTRRLRS